MRRVQRRDGRYSARTMGMLGSQRNMVGGKTMLKSTIEMLPIFS